MTQDERWLERYTEVKAFIESNHRNPSRHNPEERFKYCNWLKHNKKLLNASEMKENRVVLFEKLGGHFCDRPLCVREWRALLGNAQLCPERGYMINCLSYSGLTHR